MSTFKLDILTPDRNFFSGNVDNLILPILDGEYGVEAGHEPVVAVVEAGMMRYRVDGEWHYASVSHGLAEIMPDYSVLLVGTAEHPEEIDQMRAQRAKERAEDRLRHKCDIQKYHNNTTALARAVARLKTSKHL